MAAFTSIASDDWDDGPNTWGTAAGVYPGSADTSDTVTIADGHNVTLNVNPPYYITSITAGGNTGYITVSTTRVLLLKGNPGITYGGTNTSGFIRASGALTITHDQGGATVAVLASAAGYAIVGSGTGGLVISNSGGTACSNSSSGRCISGVGSGTNTITGLVASSGANGNVVLVSANSLTINGNGSSSNGALLRITGGAVTWNGELSTTGAGTILVSSSGGTLVWTGAHTLAADTWCNFGTLIGATLNFTDLALAVTGHFALVKSTGTITVTGASITRQTAAATAAILGDNTAAAIVTGASIPSAADTRYGVARGWADGGTGATAGCGVAGGNGLLEIPHSTAGSPTGTQDATSDACVVAGKFYGSPQREGSAAGGGNVIVIDD